MSDRYDGAPLAPDPSAASGGRRVRVDVVALVLGLVCTALASSALWRAFLGPLDWSLVKVLAPLGLVAVGVLGLALSRNRS